MPESPPLAEGRSTLEIIAIGGHAFALALEEIRHRRAETGVGNPVGGNGLDRFVAAGQLVPALRTRLDPL